MASALLIIVLFTGCGVELFGPRQGKINWAGVVFLPSGFDHNPPHATQARSAL